MVKSEVIALLKKYVALLNSEGISISKAFLFGSHSQGTASDSSDIDVLLVSDKFDETDDATVGKAWRLTRKINTLIEPILIGTKKFNDESSSIVSIAKSKGIEIV